MESSLNPNTTQDGLVEPRNSPGRSDLSGLYHLGRTLGRGHFAVVKLARHVNTGQLVAVKMIDKTKLDIMATSHLLQEVRCMRLVQHPNVVRLYEVIDTPTTLYLVMELAEGGDLYDYILRHEGGVAEGTAKRHFAQIVRAVAYCHQLHVVHRDLKPENVVFFPQQGAVKLTDFGFSNLFQPGTMLATSCGSLAYSAPEILLGEEYDAPAVDIWSLGVILYMLVCGVPPFQETNDSETLVMILDCRYCVPKHVSDDCKDLISRMLQKDPSLRASLQEIEAHQWLQGLDDALLSPEAPPHWLSGALSYRAGAPECGDLLAARPSSQQPPPASWQPSLNFTLRPAPTEEPPLAKNLPALQQICEEEDEEEEEEEGGGLVKGGNGLACLLEEEEEEEAENMVDGDESQKFRGEELGSSVEMIEEEEEEDEEEEEGKMEEVETEREDDGFVILDQPVGSGDKPLTPPELPPSSPPGFGVPCCQRHAEKTGIDEEVEPNNNTDKPHPLSSPASPDKEEQKTGTEGGEKTWECGQDEASTEKSQQHSRDECGAKAEKRHSIKLRERLFQFPLCEKALAFNIPAHNKPKILPLAQYNCCHVL